MQVDPLSGRSWTRAALALLIAAGLVALLPQSGRADTCPYRGWADDGCRGAHGGFLIARYFHAASFFSFAAQSGQQWRDGQHPWDWNSPGIDYGVGPGADVRLADPATARLPAGCEYRPTGSLAHGPAVRCGRGAVNPSLAGLDFSLHGCTLFEADAFVRGTVTLSNSRFANGPNCSVRFGYLIKIEGGDAGLSLDHDVIDEGYARNATPLVAAVVVNTATSALTVRHTAILNASQRPMSGTSSGPLDVEDSVFVGMALASFANAGQHGEIFEMGSPVLGVVYPSIVYRNNVVVIPAATAMTITAPFYPNGLNGKQHVIARFVADHNVVVTNFAGGAAASAASDIGGVVDGTVLTVNPGYLGEISVGSTIVGLSGHGAATLVRRLDHDRYQVSGTPQQGSFAHAHTLRATTSAAIAEMSYARNYEDVSITDNYVDPTGALSCIQVLNTPIDRLTIRGNRSLVTSQPIEGAGYKWQHASCPPLY